MDGFDRAQAAYDAMEPPEYTFTCRRCEQEFGEEMIGAVRNDDTVACLNCLEDELQDASDEENSLDTIDREDVAYIVHVMRMRRDVVVAAFVGGNAEAAWEMERANRVIDALQYYLNHLK